MNTLALLCLLAAPPELPATPNIVLIYVDDLGYGDVGCYGAASADEGGVDTPNIDRLAAEGVRFTDAHCTSSTCTPSRVSLLTGEYAFRRRGTGIARGDAPAIITPGRETVATVLDRAGYQSAVVGKWHLGLGPSEGEPMDWNGRIAPGPLEIGFDHCFLIPATGDRVPTVFVEDHAVVGLSADDPLRVSFKKKIGDLPTGRENPEQLTMGLTHGHDNTIVRGISRIGFMEGGRSAWWRDEMIADRITGHAVDWIEGRADAIETVARPFFLFFSLHDIHVPRVPHPRFVGATDMGPRGDVIAETDACVGMILDTLDRLRLADNTLVIFSSDNGPVLDDGYDDQSPERVGYHTPAGIYRGGKYSAFEAGTRVPTIVRWSGVVAEGTTSDALLCQVDLLGSLAKLTGQEYDAASAPDTQDQLAAWLGHDEAGREALVEHAPKTLSLRVGDWKYIPAANGPAVFQNTQIESGLGEAQLYNLAEDPGETTNLADAEPDRLTVMADRLDRLRESAE